MPRVSLGIFSGNLNDGLTEWHVNGDISDIVAVWVGGGRAFPGEGRAQCLAVLSFAGSHAREVVLLRGMRLLLKKQNVNLGYGMLTCQVVQFALNPLPGSTQHELPVCVHVSLCVCVCVCDLTWSLRGPWRTSCPTGHFTQRKLGLRR